jgi:hypothetical protein
MPRTVPADAALFALTAVPALAGPSGDPDRVIAAAGTGRGRARTPAGSHRF